MGLRRWLVNAVTDWLVYEHDANSVPLSDFKRISYEIRPCDVILIEGRSRVSEVIKTVTQSVWTHSAIYIGRLIEIENPHLRAFVEKTFKGDPHEQLIIEALLGEGTVVYPLTKYRDDHIRLCRPKGLSHQDMERVIEYSIQHLGVDYDVRQLLDLARFILPYSFLPRRWRSTLFQVHVGIPTRTVCSTMIADAFSTVRYPILPVIHRTEDGQLKMYRRNPRLYTPSDFDYSPYFDILKYPFFGFDNLAVYRTLPWNEDGVICNGVNDCFIPDKSNIKTGRSTIEHETTPEVTLEEPANAKEITGEVITETANDDKGDTEANESTQAEEENEQVIPQAREGKA